MGWRKRSVKSLIIQNQTENKAQFSIQTGEAHAWMIDLARLPIDVQRCERLLDSSEVIRAGIYLNNQDREWFVARRGILRMMLERYTGQPADSIKFERNSHGKLSVSSAPIFFNISHSQDRIALAFGLADQIGIDIERVEPIPDIAELVEKWFSPEEKKGFSLIDPRKKMDAFYHVWTQKEAFIKAVGLGLSFPLQDVCMSVDPDKSGKVIRIRHGQARLWKIAAYALDPGWKVALCLPAEKYQKIICQEISNLR